MKTAVHGMAFLSLLVLSHASIAVEQKTAPFRNWFWHVTAAAPVLHFNDEGSPYRFSLGAGRPVLDDHLSLMADLVYAVYDVNAVADNHPDPNVKGGYSSSLGFDLLARWDVKRAARYTCYLEGGAGFQTMLEAPPFPADGSDQNFTLFAGPGVHVPIGERSRLALSIQWFHISNAYLFANNSGYDGVQLICGTEWSF